MTRLLPITAKALHQRNAVLNGDLILKASVFPFFHPNGDIERILVVDPHTTTLWACRPGDVMRLPWYRAVWIENAEPLRDPGLIRDFGGLLHYDPWWVLAIEPFPMLDAVPVLKATNCVDDFKPGISGLYFSGDLKRVKSSYVHSGDECSSTAFDKHYARLSEHQRKLSNALPGVVAADNSGWRLAPFWEK